MDGLIAFKDFNAIKGIMGSPWVGLKNFETFLATPDFMNMVLSTLKLSAYGLLFGFPIPIILALMIHRVKSVGLKKKMQLILYAPNFISLLLL